MFKSRNQTTPQQPFKLALALFQHFCRIKKNLTKILYTPLQSTHPIMTSTATPFLNYFLEHVFVLFLLETDK